MPDNCEFCGVVKSKEKYKIYFESDEIIVLERHENLAIALMKQHITDIPENKINGLIKILLTTLNKNKPNKRCSVKYADDCKEHYGIYATIK